MFKKNREEDWRGEKERSRRRWAKSFKSGLFWVGPKLWVFLSHMDDLRDQL